MLMRNPEYRSQQTLGSELAEDDFFVTHSAREMLLGQIVLMALFLIAILLRSIA